MTQGTARKLAAIMVADVAGFSRLMERDESLTFARLLRLREEVAHPKVEAFGGRVIKTTGDGFLAEFPSASSALRCGIEIQRSVISLETGQADEDRIRFRIGINVGDVIIDGDDIAGDGVNIAARLESLSAVDGLCISAAVRDQIHDELGVTFVDLGDQKLKNISRPIRAFAVAAVVASTTPGAKPPTEAAKADGSAQAPSLRRLSVVVLPFANASGDPAQEYFSDGITDDVTAQLSGIKGSYVIGRNTAFAYKGKLIDIKALGKELGVRYVLQGSVERHEDGIDASLHLTDSLSGAMIWADSIEVDKAAVRNIRREVVTRMAIALNLQLLSAEVKRSLGENQDNPDAVDLVMRGWYAFYRSLTVEGFRAAQRVFEAALAIQPHWQPALVGRARSHVAQAFAFPGPDRPRQIAEAEIDVVEAIRQDPQDEQAHHTLARVRMLQARTEAAIAEADIALELNPNLVEALALKGFLLTLNGQPELAFEPIRRVLAQSPRDPIRWTWLLWIGIACLVMGRFEEAIPWLEKSAALSPSLFSSAYLAACYAQIGEMDKALAAKAELLKFQPNFSIGFFKNMNISTNPVFLAQMEDKFYSGLRKLGIPE